MTAISCLHHTARILAFVTALVMIVCTLTPAAGGFDPTSLYAYHPFAMIIGWVLASSLGMTAYVSDFGKLNRRFPDRGSRRLLHATIQIFAAMCIVIGYLLHFTLTQSKGGSHIASGDPTWAKVHVWMGIISVAGVVLQAIIGMYKYVVRTREGHTIMKYHGYLGIAVWLCGLLTISVAVYGVFWYQHDKPAVAISIWVLLALLICSTLVTVFMDPARKASNNQQDDSGYGNKLMDDSSDLLYDGPRDSMGSLNGKPLLR